MAGARTITKVSVVLETDSVHPSDDVSIGDCLEALARQDYPREPPAVIVPLALASSQVAVADLLP